MKLIQTLCCSALINPFYPMVEAHQNQYPLSHRLLRVIAGFIAGGTMAQSLGCLSAYLLMEDSQAAGMIAHLLIQHLSYYFLGCAFVLLSLSNILIKRGVSRLKAIRVPSLILIICVAATSFLLIPRMDYLQETALQDGMPVMASPFANYFVMLNGILLVSLSIQIFSSCLIAWRMSDSQSP